MLVRTFWAAVAVVTMAQLFLIFAPTSASDANARPSTKSFTCSGLKNFIDRNGAVVMNTKNNRVFDRLVANNFYCLRGTYRERVVVPTKNGRCRVLRCGQRRFFDD